jgi:hypothetical protein
MYRFIQKHGKKLMAVFAAFLMISFAATGLSPGGSGRNPVVGRIDGEKIRGQDVFAARADWQLLQKIPDQRGRPLSSLLGPQTDAEISRNPILFLLLQKEAQQLGVTVSNDTLQGMLTNTPGLITTDPDRNEQIARAVRGLLLIAQTASRAGSVIKITEPMVKHELAQLGQSINLNLVDFTTAKYLDQARSAEPTAEQIKAHFEKYADTIPGTPSDANPFGFGYKYPDRVKLQYIVVPKSDVRKVVEASRSAYDWDVEGRKYYRQNQAEFKPDATTQPRSSFDLTAPSSQPTTKPYEAVQQDVRDKLISRETDARMTAIRNRITSTLSGDWVAYHNATGGAGAKGATTSSTAPSTATASSDTSQGVPYPSFEYLQKLAQQIQANKDFGVLPTTVSVADRWLTMDELNQLPGIGQANFNGVPLGSYILSMARPFLSAEQLKEQSSGWLRVMEPTRAMTDANDSLYIARISAAEPAHRPAAIAEVEERVKNDLATARAYELAKADAEKTLEAARQQGLKEAAAGKPVITAGPLTNRPGQVVPALALTGQAADRFVARAFKLLSAGTSSAGVPSAEVPSAGVSSAGATTQASPSTAVASTQGAGGAKKPIELIELPRDGRVLVAELGDVQAMWTDRSLPMEEAQIQMALGRRLAQAFAQGWFNFDSVVARTKFVPEGEGEELLQHGTAPQQPVAPIF